MQLFWGCEQSKNTFRDRFKPFLMWCDQNEGKFQTENWVLKNSWNRNWFFPFPLTLQSSMLIRGKLIFKSVPNNKKFERYLKNQFDQSEFNYLLNKMICKNMTWPQNNSSSILTDSKSVSLKMSPLLVLIIEISFNLT